MGYTVRIGNAGCGLCGESIVQVYDKDAEFFDGNPVDYPTWEFCPNCKQGDLPPDAVVDAIEDITGVGL